MSNPLAEQEPDRVASHTHITTHAFDGAGQLYRQFREKPKLRAVLIAMLNRIQELEDALWDVLTKTTLDTATGASLDQLGKVLGFSRGLLSDDEQYRTVLRAVVLVHRSTGTADEVIAVVQLLLGAGSFAYAEGAASILITTSTSITLPVDVVATLTRAARDAGIQLQITTPPADPSLLFRFSTDPFRITTGATGFSDTAQLAGGLLNGVV